MRTTVLFRMILLRKLTFLLIFIAFISCSKEKVTNDALGTELHADLKNYHASSDKETSGTTLTSFDATKQQLPESIALDRHGNIYLSMSPLRQIWKLDPAGNASEVFASFQMEEGLFGISGLRFDKKKGNLYVAVSSATFPDMNGVWKIDQNGEKERLAGTGDVMLPNDVAILPNGTIYITDSAKGGVWRILPGEEAEIWIQDVTLEGTGAFGLGVPVGANGIVVSHRGSTGTVIISNTEKGQLLSIPVLPDGSAGEPEIIVADPRLFGLDGITQDPFGNIYAAVNSSSKIVKINLKGDGYSEIASGAPLDFPTSLAFGTGIEKHSLFVTNFSVIHFLHQPPTVEEANPGVIVLRSPKNSSIK